MTNMQQDHQLDEVIRQAEKTVDPRVHGPGFVKILDVKKGTISNKLSTIARVLGSKDIRYYFVKLHGKPAVISNWRFKWLEGTSEVELEFDCTFEIGLSNENDAERLVKALGGYESPTTCLYRLIDSYLHATLSKMYEASSREGENILAAFEGIRGESTQLNKEVSKAVASNLGGQTPFLFRGGFKLLSAPPMQVQFSQIPIAFEVSDSTTQCTINTSALFVLDNYQKYKTSGLNDAESIENHMKSALKDAIQLHLFGKPYYSVVKDFSHSITQEIEAHLAKVATSIGYQVKMFQSLTDIESMELLDGMRVDMDAEDAQFSTKNEIGHVKVSVSVELKVADFNLLKRLIKPGQSAIKPTLKHELIKICRDVIGGIERRAFNLSFDEEVVPCITESLTEKLGKRYGLEVHVIKVEQEPTEDAQRFLSLHGNTQHFEFNIRSYSDAGVGDQITIKSAYEIVGISENGWENFEKKDFGYRDSSDVWTPEERQRMTDLLEIHIDNLTPEEFARERRAEAIRRELNEIARRIKMVVEQDLETRSDLAFALRETKHYAEGKRIVEMMAADAIREEWGLEIKLRAFKRLQDRSELTEQIKLDNAHQLMRDQSKADLERHAEVRDLVAKDGVEYVKTLMARRKQLMSGEEDSDLEDEALQEELQRIEEQIAERMPQSETLLDMPSAKQLTSIKKVDKSWSMDGPLLEDNSKDT